MESNTPSRRCLPARGEWVAPIVLALAVLAAGLPGLDVLLPHQPEPDAYAARQIEVLAGNEPPEPTFFFYPLLLARLAGAIPLDAWPLSAAGLEGDLHRASAPWLRVRLISLLAHAAAVLLVYALARRFLGKRASLFASLLLAVSLVPGMYAVQGRPHMLALACVGTGLWLAVRLVERPSPGRSLALGFGLFLAGGALHSGWVLAGAAVVAHGIAAARGYDRRRALAGAMLTLVVGAAAVPALYPTWSGIVPPVQGAAIALPEVEAGVLRWGQHRLELERFAGRSPFLWLRRFWEYDPALLVLSAAGLFSVLTGLRGRRSWTRRTGPALVLAAHALAYAAVLSMYAKPMGRYLLPLYPVCAILAAGALGRALRVVRGGGWGPASAVGAAALVAASLLLPAQSAMHLWRLRQRPDTAEQAAAWLDERAGPDQPVGMATVTSLPRGFVPVGFDDERLSWIRSQPWPKYLLGTGGVNAGRAGSGRLINLSRFPRRSELREQLTELRGGYLVVEGSQRTAGMHPGRRHLDHLVGQLGEPVAVFSPCGEGAPSQRFYDYGDIPDQRAYLLNRDHLGPRLEIYRIPGGPARPRPEHVRSVEASAPGGDYGLRTASPQGRRSSDTDSVRKDGSLDE